MQTPITTRTAGELNKHTHAAAIARAVLTVTGVLGLVFALLACAPAHADAFAIREPRALVAHGMSEHVGTQPAYLQERNPGIGIRWDRYAAGCLRNSYNAVACYGTRVFRYGRFFALEAGAITGYADAPWTDSPVAPLLALTVQYHALAVSYLPTPQGGVLLFSTRLSM